MSRRRVRLPLCGLTALALAAPVAAQTPGLPVHGASFPSGVHLAATAAWSGASNWVGEAFTLGGTVGYAGSRAGIAGTLGYINPESGDGTIAGGLLGALRVLGGGLDVPFQVDLLGGFGGYDSGDDVAPGFNPARKDWHLLAGAGFTLSIATPVVSIRPWLAPRAEFFEELDGAGYAMTSRFAGSAGVELRFLGGFGLRASWDKIEGDDQIVAVGASYRF